MKKKLIVLIMMSVCAIFNVTADDFASQEKRVAVLPFTIKGKFDPLYAEVALDNFITRLIQGKVYRVVERSQLDKAMKELKFQSGNDFDESSAMEVGKLAGAEIVVIGIVTALKDQAVVNIRGISVKTGIAEFAEKDFLRTQEDLLTSVEKIADKFSQVIIAQKQRAEAELARQRQMEQARELAKKRELEMAKQREAELARQRELELEKQRKMELIKQQHEQAKKREAELAKQRELEMAKQREAELAKQRELELEKQRKMELIKQRHEQAKQREAELAKQRELEMAKQQEAELARQRELELEKQRKMELIKQRHEQAKQQPTEQANQHEQELAKQSEKSTPKHWKEKFVNDLEKDLADFERRTEQAKQNKKKSANIDFSVSKEYENAPLSPAQKKFLAKYFQQKWKIDPTDTKKVHDIYKKHIGAGAALATMGSIITVAGLAMTIAGFCYFDYCSTAWNVYTNEIDRIKDGDGYYYGFYNKDELRFYEEKRDSLDSSFPAFITGIVGIPVIFAVGLPMLISSSYPFGVAKHAKDIYTKITGNKSFTPRVSTTGGFNGKDRKLEIAFGCQF